MLQAGFLRCQVPINRAVSFSQSSKPGWNINRGNHGISLYFLCLTSELCCLPLWWNCPRTARQFRSGNTLIFSVCNSDPACRCLHCSPLFVVCRRSHRLRASVWGTAGGDHLPRGVARGKNHHELQGSGQSTCHIHVTYVPHKPGIFTTRCVLCLPSFHISPGIISALPVLTLLHLPGLHYMYEVIRAVIGCEISILKGFPPLVLLSNDLHL